MLASRKNRYLLSGIAAAVIVIVVVIVLIATQGSKKDTKKTYKVGIINGAAILNSTVDGLKGRMTELGYTEGQNITYVYNGPVAKDQFEAEIQNLIDQKVDVIVALTTPVATKVKEMTAQNQIPVVFAPLTDPLGAGIVPSLQHPGGNMTGIISGLSEDRRLEWLKTVAPTIKRVYYPYNPNDPSPSKTLESLKPVAATLGLELVILETPDKAAVQAAVDNVPSDVDAIFIPPDSLVGSLVANWVAKAAELKLPTSGSSQAHVQAGVLCSYSYSPTDAGRLAAGLVDQILKGAKPGDLPVETASPLSSINLATAQSIGLEIPDDTLRQAQSVLR